MASGIYNQFKRNLLTKQINLTTDDIKIALYNASLSFVATNATFGQLSYEVSGAGYTTGGTTLVSMSVSSAANATIAWDAVDTAWASATFTARYAALYDNTLTGKDLIGLIDFSTDKSVSSGTFTIQWHADGIITIA